MSDRTTVEQAARRLARAEAREADAREERDRAICQAHAAGVRRATIASAVEMEPESVSRIVKQRRDAAGADEPDGGALERAADQARRARAAASARAAAPPPPFPPSLCWFPPPRSFLLPPPSPCSGTHTIF